jgi:hypothetical protein
MAPTIEKISAITLQVLNMRTSVQFIEMCSAWNCFTAENARVSLHSERTIQKLQSLTSNKVTVCRSGAG